MFAAIPKQKKLFADATPCHASYPIKVLTLPEDRSDPAWYPKAVLLLPVVLKYKALYPEAVL